MAKKKKGSAAPAATDPEAAEPDDLGNSERSEGGDADAVVHGGGELTAASAPEGMPEEAADANAAAPSAGGPTKVATTVGGVTHDTSEAAASFEPLQLALREMGSAVLRTEGLATLHAIEEGADDIAVPEITFDGLGALARRTASPEHAFVCLTDGAVVEAHELLIGARRGAPYLSVAEAEAQCAKALHSAKDALEATLSNARQLAIDATDVPNGWAAWEAEAKAESDAGFDELQRALDVQREAAKKVIVSRRRKRRRRPPPRARARAGVRPRSSAVPSMCMSRRLRRSLPGRRSTGGAASRRRSHR